MPALWQVLIESFVFYFGGIPPGGSESPTAHLLSTEQWELRTSALLKPLLPMDEELNRTCSLYLGSIGSPAQLWTCGPRLRDRNSSAVLSDNGTDYYYMR